MGGAACKEVINQGNIAIGVVDVFKERNPQISVAELRAALNEATQSILYSSLYFELTNIEVLTHEITDAIVNPIKSIINNLPTKVGKEAKEYIDSCSKDLRIALDKLEGLFGE